MTRALTKQLLEETKIASRLFIYYDSQSFDQMDPFSFYMAICFQNDEILRFFFHILGEGLVSTLETLLDHVHFSSLDGYTKPPCALHFAAATGNQSVLRMCVKKIDNLMIEDDKGRTALHYAADANMFEYLSPPIAFFCSVDNYCKVEQLTKKFKEEPLSTMNRKVQKNPTDPQPDLNVGRRACILMLQQAGLDLQQEDYEGNIPDPGTSNDAFFQRWWNELLVKDTTDKKNNFNQAGNALSVVGTLVAATSYIGPLQPPLNYANDGYVETSKVLVKVFMWTNTLAFYMAIASVMSAVVPSLPMPQEGVLDELRRAQRMVSFSLLFLIASIASILVSFAAATAVVVDTEDYYGRSNFLLGPSVIGWLSCLIVMVSLFIRVMRLWFYKNSLVRRVYKFSFSRYCKERRRILMG